jgi:hypothetical protein
VTAPKAQLIIATSIRLAKQIKSSDYKIGKGYRLPPPSRRGRKERSSPFPSPDYSFPSRLASSPPPPPRNQGQAMEASGPEAANPGIDGSADPCSSAGRLSVHQIVGGGKGTATTTPPPPNSPAPSPSAKFGVNFAYANSLPSGCHGAAMSPLINS